jgi:hypothetical protein
MRLTDCFVMVVTALAVGCAGAQYLPMEIEGEPHAALALLVTTNRFPSNLDGSRPHAPFLTWRTWKVYVKPGAHSVTTLETPRCERTTITNGDWEVTREDCSSPIVLWEIEFEAGKTYDVSKGWAHSGARMTRISAD